MKKFVLLLVSTLLSLTLVMVSCSKNPAAPSSLSGQNSPAGPDGTLPGYDLLWSDEFNLPNGSPPDPSNWTLELGNNGGWGNGEVQYYTSSTKNAFCSNGNLYIRVINESYSGFNYTSARLISASKRTFTPTSGHPLRIEARIKVPTGNGYWPAFWMMGQNFFSGVSWPYCGEIDIMEVAAFNPFKCLGTFHYGYSGTNSGTPWWTGDCGWGGFDTTCSTNLANNYHVYRVDWDSTGKLTWYFDGVSAGNVTPGHYVFDGGKSFFLLLNVAVGGSLGGNASAGTYPGAMVVDYVRVYQVH